MSQTKSLAVVGHHHSGKTTFITTALTQLDWGATPESSYQLLHSLQHDWNRLNQNQNVEHYQESRSFELVFKNLNHLAITDMAYKALESGELNTQSFDGLICCVELSKKCIHSHMHAIDFASLLFQSASLPMGLVFTKGDQVILDKDSLWEHKDNWWEHIDFLKPYSRVITRFGKHVWPISAFGFNQLSQPACLLNECGQLIPYRIHPINLDKPVNTLLQEMFQS